jgi:hypothetical protein
MNSLAYWWEKLLDAAVALHHSREWRSKMLLEARQRAAVPDPTSTPQVLHRAAWPDRAALLRQRMNLLGMNIDEFGVRDARSLEEMQRRCSECQNSARCEHDLAQKSPTTEWGIYCPNALPLTAMIASKIH